MASAHRGFLSSAIYRRHEEGARPVERDTPASFFLLALRLGQGLVNRCNQLSQILWGGFMYDIE
jgi:hypothetical protein